MQRRMVAVIFTLFLLCFQVAAHGLDSPLVKPRLKRPPLLTLTIDAGWPFAMHFARGGGANAGGDGLIGPSLFGDRNGYDRTPPENQWVEDVVEAESPAPDGPHQVAADSAAAGTSTAEAGPSGAAEAAALPLPLLAGLAGAGALCYPALRFLRRGRGRS